MRILRILVGLLAILFYASCKMPHTENEFIFVNDYCTTITVGGIVGVKEKCFYKDDVVVAESVTDSSIVIRIAGHSERNKENGPSSFQELLKVPKEYVKTNR